MDENKDLTCQVCGTPLVKSKKDLKKTLDGSRTLDGSWDLGDMVCPKCHPELVESK